MDLAPLASARRRSCISLLLLGGLLAAPSARSATCTSSTPFLPQGLVPTAHQPVEIVVADFNGDGVPDLAATNSYLDGSGVGSVSIMLAQVRAGAGTGRFLAHTDFPVGGKPLGIVAGDFNSDGIKDLAVGNYGSNSVTVLLGQGSGGVGNGSFGPPVDYPAGNKPYELVAADFNGDGITDLAVCDNGEPSIKILIGQGSAGHGNGTFVLTTSLTLSDLSTSIAAFDFNGDGITDLVATENYHNTVAIFQGLGSGGVGNGMFNPTPTHVPLDFQPYDVAVGDFDADGRPDLAVVGGPAHGVAILFGNSSFLAPPTLMLPGTDVSGVAVSDIDGDGILDLVLTSGDGNSLIWLAGHATGGVADGTFAAPVTLANCCFPIHPVTADLNGNGFPDAVTAGYDNNAVGVFLDACSLSPQSPVLTAVRDVPNDQGGKVFVTWIASSLDVTGGPIINYRVWRRIPPAVAQTRVTAVSPSPASPIRVTRVTRADGVTDIVYWEALATLPAQRLQGYGYTAPTTQDSMPGSNPYSVFFISALTSDIDVFYDSNPDSGYSVDNLAPATPTPFAAQFGTSGVALHWGASHESDFSTYQIHRGGDPDFVPSAATLIRTQPDTGFFDPNGSSFSIYKLAAVDVHGNASAYATAQLNIPTPVTVSLESAEVTADAVSLIWYLAGVGAQPTVLRSENGSGWSGIASLEPDGTGKVAFQDHSLIPGDTYRYALSLDGAMPIAGSEAVVTIPALTLSLAGLTPNPQAAGRGFVVAFSLATAEPAALEVFDASGRRVAARDVTSLGPGRHHVDLGGEARFRPGLYLVRLRQSGRMLGARAVLLN